MHPPPTTREILAYRRLGRTVDQRWIDWAIELLVRGHDTPTLRVMASERPPFHAFELWAITDKVVSELGLRPFSDKAAAARALTGVRVSQMLRREVSHADGLAELHQLHIEHDLTELSDFSMLRYALDDLQHGDFSYYWPTADRMTIYGCIDDYCNEWLAQHQGDAPDDP